MRKKYLLKSPSQPYMHLEYSSLLNNSHQIDPLVRHSHNKPGRPLPHRMKTEPNANEVRNSHSLKRREVSVGNLQKGRYYLGGK